jgi:hypothetical protein
MIGLGTSPSTASFVPVASHAIATAFMNRVIADGGTLESYHYLTGDLDKLL